MEWLSGSDRLPRNAGQRYSFGFDTKIRLKPRSPDFGHAR
jgi:hypothetical protein